MDNKGNIIKNLTSVFVALISFLLVSFSTNLKAKNLPGLQENVPIGEIEGVTLFINIALPASKSDTPRPVVMLIHGGGFVSGDKSAKNKQIVKLSQMGFVAVSAMYRLSPKYRFPAQLEDIKLAIRYLKANAKKYHINPQRILLSGSSAGSYLAVMAGVTGNSELFSDHGLYADYDASVRAVAAQSAPIGDFRLAKYGQRPTVQRLLPHDVENLEQTLSLMSPMTHLDVNDPPFFLSHGSADPIIPVEMTREFVVS